MRGPLPALRALGEAIAPAWPGAKDLVWPLTQVVAIWAGVSLLPLGVEPSVQTEITGLAQWSDPQFKIRAAAQKALDGEPEASQAFAKVLALPPRWLAVTEDYLRGLAPKLAKPMAEKNKLDPEPKFAHLMEQSTGEDREGEEEGATKGAGKVGTDEPFGPTGPEDPNYKEYEGEEEEEGSTKGAGKVGTDEPFGPTGPEDPNYKEYEAPKPSATSSEKRAGIGLGLAGAAALLLLLFVARRRRKSIGSPRGLT